MQGYYELKGYNDPQAIPRIISDISKREQMHVTNVERLGITEEDGFPQTLRHSCVQTGVAQLHKSNLSYTLDASSVLEVPYYTCSKCGKVYIPRKLERRVYQNRC